MVEAVHELPAGEFSVRRLLAEASRMLAQRGVEQSTLEAEILLAYTMHRPRILLYDRADPVLTPIQEKRFWGFVRRRVEGEPLAYLTGEKEFFSLAFHVNRSVLIPRPETEHVVEAALEKLRGVADAGRAPTFFDVGTGSGAIAVAILVTLPGSRGIASDLSRAALRVARRNARRHGVADRLTWIEGDLFDGFAGEVDVVVSNPPYVGENERGILPLTVRDYEPPDALFAGADGLAVIRRLVDQAPNHLLPGGWLIFEIGYSHEIAARGLLEATGQWAEVEIRNDLAGIPRVVIARKR